MTDIRVDARNLRKIYNGLEAVCGVSFHVKAGECFGILGPNGAGKTSIIKMLYGFSPLSGGEIYLFGLELTRNLRVIKNRLGVCQQENSLDPDLSVLMNLIVFARYFNIPAAQAKRRAEKLLTFFGLEHRLYDRVIDLSGGMMRRLVLARALINEPELLILDEPTTGLDPQSRNQVWERFMELKSQGLSILLTTHYMEEAARLCDRLIILDYGRILTEGKPRDLVRTYIGHEVIEITGVSHALREYLKEKGISFEDTGTRILIYNGEDSLYREISHHCHREGCLLRMATLEDVFLKLTGRELRE